MDHILNFRPGDQARICVPIEHGGFEDDDPEQEFTVILTVGQVVTVAGVEVEARNAETGAEASMIAITAPDTEGIDRTFTVDTTDLTSAALV